MLRHYIDSKGLEITFRHRGLSRPPLFVPSVVSERRRKDKTPQQASLASFWPTLAFDWKITVEMLLNGNVLDHPSYKHEKRLPSLSLQLLEKYLMRSVMRMSAVVFATLLLSFSVFARQDVQAATLTIATTEEGSPS